MLTPRTKASTVFETEELKTRATPPSCVLLDAGVMI